MKTTSARIDGAVVFWKTGESVLARLAALADIDLGAFIPKPRTAGAALKDALNDLYANKTTMVRPLDKLDGYAVVDESRGDERNEYATKIAAWLTESAAGSGLIVQGLDADHGRILAAMDASAGRVSQWSTTAMLVGIVGHLGGVPLRPAGGVYWLPLAKLPAWEAAAAVIEPAAYRDGENAVYAMRTAADEAAHRAVEDAITADAAKQVAEIEQAISAGDMKVRGLRSREQELRELRAKVGGYEAMLAKTLDRTRAILDAADQAAAKAIVLAAAQEGAAHV